VLARTEQDVQNGEQQKGAGALLHDKGRAEKRSAAQIRRHAATIDRAREDEQARENGRQDEVLGVGRGREQSRAQREGREGHSGHHGALVEPETALEDRKSTRLNSSHQIISYAVFCLKKKKYQ